MATIIRCIIKWCSFSIRACTFNLKHLTASTSLCGGPISYLFCQSFTLSMHESKYFPYSNLSFSPLGKNYMVGKDPGTYIQLNIHDHELILLTVIPKVNMLGGETLSPHLPLCLTETICSKNMI